MSTPKMTIPQFISTTTELAQMLAQLNTSPTVPPHLYVDLEGINLCRYGSISILTLYDRSMFCVYLIDIFTLGPAAFTTPAATQATFTRPVRRANGDGTMDLDLMPDDDTPPMLTLKAILESSEIPKVFFDARNDSDALYAHYGVQLQGVQDLQVMELATRGGGRNRDRVNGLAKCIEFGLKDMFTPLQRAQIQNVKDVGAKLFAPEKGGRYGVFNERPLPATLVHYCMQDVVHMPALWNVYNSRLKLRFWKWVVSTETEKRIKASLSPKYVPQGKHKSLGWSWEYLRTLERQWNG